ncbi:ABC transporter family substrate-binding protein [Arachnia propionica]|uniref:ABC transporter family substrate-binding protein n=1 Tax=Arachnia propionica TaxID=1750 RepID=UPI0030CBC23E
MKFRGTNAALAVLVSGALLLSGCTSGEEAEGEAKPAASETAIGGDNPCARDAGIKETADGQVVYSPGPGKWDGYNTLTSRTNSVYNSVVMDQVLSNFVYFGTDGTICEDKEFGSFEVLSQDPLEMKYTISDKAKWSDGTPITINDFLLGWASQNPEFVAPGLISGTVEGAEAVFDHVSTMWPEQVPEGPQGEINGKTFTMKFKGAYPDYKIMVDPPLPAHVVATKSGLTPDQLAQAIQNRDGETVRKVAEFWNKKWIFNPGELPEPDVIPSSNRYQIKAWKDNNVTLEANPNYWGTPAGTKNLVFSYVDDNQMAQSLQNGDLDVIRPHATVDTVNTLNSIGSSVNVATYPERTYEHLDFNFLDKSVFSDSQGGQKLREAFAYCIPRQTIVDNIIKPIDPNATVMNVREAFPGDADYETLTSASYDGRYDTVDIEKAKQLVAESGVQTPVKVRLGYKAGNQRRTETVQAIQSSCKDAGFNVEDTAKEDFFAKDLKNGDYEVALYAWSSAGQIATGQNIMSSGRQQNYGKYSNPVVDEAWDKVTNTLDRGEQVEQLKVIEKQAWDTLFNIPLYAHPAVVAWKSKVKNVRPTATQVTVSWNAYQWRVK